VFTDKDGVEWQVEDGLETEFEGSQVTPMKTCVISVDDDTPLDAMVAILARAKVYVE